MFRIPFSLRKFSVVALFVIGFCAGPAWAVKLVPVGPLSVSIYPYNSLTLRVAITRDTSAPAAGDCTVKWSVTPPLVPTDAFANVVYLPPNTLTPAQYEFRADAGCPEGTASLAFKIDVKQPPAPSGGSCTATPAPAASSTAFQLVTGGWQNAARTAFFVRKPDGQLQQISAWFNASEASALQELPYFGPQPLVVECHAISSAGVQAHVDTSVTVPKPVPKYVVVVKCTPSPVKPSGNLTLQAVVVAEGSGALDPASLSYAWSIAPAARIAFPPTATVQLGAAQLSQLRPGTQYIFTANVTSGGASIPGKCLVDVQPDAPAPTMRPIMKPPTPLMQPQRVPVYKP
jgi:hypothetical protein